MLLSGLVSIVGWKYAWLTHSDVAVVGAGVVGCATTLALARRGVSVALLEAETAPGLAASGTNSGIVHTGFDSAPGELETELILRSGRAARPGVRGARLAAACAAAPCCDRATTASATRSASWPRTRSETGSAVELGEDGSLSVPGEAVTDPVAYTAALAAAAQAPWRRAANVV